MVEQGLDLPAKAIDKDFDFRHYPERWRHKPIEKVEIILDMLPIAEEHAPNPADGGEDEPTEGQAWGYK